MDSMLITPMQVLIEAPAEVTTLLLSASDPSCSPETVHSLSVSLVLQELQLLHDAFSALDVCVA